MRNRETLRIRPGLSSDSAIIAAMERLGARHLARVGFVGLCALAAAATSRMPCDWYVRDSGQSAGCATVNLGAKRDGRQGARLLLVVSNPGEAACALSLRTVSIERGGTATPSPAELSLAPH